MFLQLPSSIPCRLKDQMRLYRNCSATMCRFLKCTNQKLGRVAQLVERSLSMRKVLGSIPNSSIFASLHPYFLLFIDITHLIYPFSHHLVSFLNLAPPYLTAIARAHLPLTTSSHSIPIPPHVDQMAGAAHPSQEDGSANVQYSDSGPLDSRTDRCLPGNVPHRGDRRHLPFCQHP